MSAAVADDLRVRAATRAEIPLLESLIAASARELGKGFYTDAENEAAIACVFGVDSDLVDDGTYLVAEDEGGAILGCGGWSRRRTLFGGDNFSRMALMATLPGEPFYAARGYAAREPIELQCGETNVRFVPMERSLLQNRHNRKS